MDINLYLLVYTQVRYNHQKSFLSRIIQNVRNEFNQNKDLRDNLEKFRKETQKLEETEAIKQAREKYKKVEAESLKDVNEMLQTARDALKSGVDKAKEAELFKKTAKLAGDISKQGESIKDSAAFKKISETVERELVLPMDSSYIPPEKLFKRSERLAATNQNDAPQRAIQPDDQTKFVELHKDSKWSKSWAEFKEENPIINKIFEIKTKYDESDNSFVIVTKNFVEKVNSLVGGLFQRTDISEVLTQICKVDPNFDLNNFLKDCEKFIIPNILEAMNRGDLDVLSDWCHEAVFNVLSQPQKEAQKLGMRIHTKILDLQNLELAMGKMMEQGPVLVLTFHVQQVSYVKDSKGNVVEGDSDKIVQNTYVMAFCRDQNDLRPETAWRLIDVAMQQSQFMF